MYEFQLVCQQQMEPNHYAKLLSRWARAELLKEKVKQRMEMKYGKQLDNLADLIVEVAEEQARNHEKMENKEEELENAFDELDSWEA